MTEAKVQVSAMSEDEFQSITPTTITSTSTTISSTTHLDFSSTGWFMTLALTKSAGQPRTAETRPAITLQDGATLSCCLILPYTHARDMGLGTSRLAEAHTQQGKCVGVSVWETGPSTHSLVFWND